MDTVSYVGEHSDARAQLAGPRLIVALSCDAPCATRNMKAWVSRSIDLTGKLEVTVGRSRTIFERAHTGTYWVVTIPDEHLSQLHFRLVYERAPDAASETGSNAGVWRLHDDRSKNGTWVNGIRVSEAVLHDNDVIESGSTILLFRSASAHQGVFWARGRPDHEIALLSTLNPELAAMLDSLRRIAPSDVSVLLHGETGVGKEVVARAVHQLSGRAGAFVAVNCGALPEGLVESQLFGVVRGAYSGAVGDRPGLIRSADGGTLFLDEIAEMPLASQAALLRVLQERQVTPVGGETAIPVDIRVVAATHQYLPSSAERGAFRHDLLARLRDCTLVLPPLCRRREDIGLLIANLLHRQGAGATRDIRFSREAGGALFRYHWPYNVRELERALKVAMLHTDDGLIQMAHLPRDIALGPDSGLEPDSATLSSSSSSSASMRRLEPSIPVSPERLVALNERYRGNVSAIARELGTSRSQVARLFVRYDIERAR